MATEVEERIVQMKFDNAQFEKGAKQSLLTLEKLDGVLDRLGQGGLDHLANTLDVVERRFSSFGIAGMTAIQKITNSAIDLGMSLMTAIPRQIISGGTTRALNLEQAKFQLKGLGIEWEQAYKAMDYAVSGTAYGLDEAAKAAAQFAASNKAMLTTADDKGITDMMKALRAISGVAGMTNSSYDEIAHIFTGIAGTGKVMTQDLRMLEGRGLNVAAKLAEVLSDGPENIKYTEEQIRELVTKGEIDFLTFAKAMDYAFGDHAKKANETYTGSLANMKAALSRIGADFVEPWHNGMIKVQNALRQVFDLARKVTRPFAEGHFTQWTERLSDIISRLVGNIKFGWLENLLNLAGGAGDKILNVLEAITDAFPRGLFGEDKILAFTNQDAMNRYSKLQHTLAGIRVIFDSLKKIGKGVFENLFGGKSFDAVELLDKLLDKGKQFGDWIVNLKGRNQGFAPQIQNAVTRISNVLQSASKVFKSAGNVIAAIIERIFGYFSKNGSKMAGRFGTIFNGLADGLTGVNSKLSAFLDKIAEFIREHGILSGILEAVSDGFWNLGSGIWNAIQKVTDFVKGLLGIEDGANAWEKISNAFQTAGEKIRGAFDLMRNGLQEIFAPGGIGEGAITVASLLYTALFGYRKFQTTKWSFQRLGRGIELIRHSGQTLWKWMKAINPLEYMDKVETVLGRTSGALRAFADNLNAKSLLAVGAAVLVLATGLAILFALAGDTQRLTVAITALAVVMGLLVAAAWGLRKAFGGTGEIIKGLKGTLNNLLNAFAQGYNFKIMAQGLLYFAGAVLVLAVAVGVFAYTYSKFGWQGLAAGVAAMAVAIGILVAAVALLDKYVKTTMPFKMAGIAIALVSLGVALMLVVGAMWILSRLSWSELAKGMIGVAFGIGLMVAAIAFLGSSIEGKGARIKLRAALLALSLVAVAAAVLILAVAIRVIASLPMQQLGLALGTLAIGLFAMVAALALLSQLKPGKLLAAGVAMIAAGVAMILLAAAMTIMTVALMALSVVPYDALMNSLKALGLTLLGIVAALVILGAMGPIVLAAGGAILMVGIAFLALGAGLSLAGTGIIKLAVAANMLQGVNLWKLAGGLLALSGALAALGIGGLLTSFASGGFDGLVVLATAMKMMQGLDFKTLNDKKNGLRELAKSIAAFGGLRGIWLGLGSGGMLAAGPGFISLAEGLKAMVPALQQLNEMENPDKALGIYETLAKSARKFMSIGGFNKKADTKGFADAIVALVPAILQLDEIKDPYKAVEVLGAIASAGQKMGSAGFFQHNTDMMNVANAIATIVPVLKEMNEVQDTAKVRQVLGAIAEAGEIMGTTEFWNKSVDVTSVGNALSAVIPVIQELNSVTVDPNNIRTILIAIGDAGSTLASMPLLRRQTTNLHDVSDALTAIIPTIKELNDVEIDAESVDIILWAIAMAGNKLAGISIFRRQADVEAIGNAITTILPALKALDEIQVTPAYITEVLSGIASAGNTLGSMSVFERKTDVIAIGDALKAIIPTIKDLDSVTTDGTKISEIVGAVAAAGNELGTMSVFQRKTDVEAIAAALTTIIPALTGFNGITVSSLQIRQIIGAVAEAGNTLGTMSIFDKKSNVTDIADALKTIIPVIKDFNGVTVSASDISEIMEAIGTAGSELGSMSVFTKKANVTEIADALNTIIPALTSINDIHSIEDLKAVIGLFGTLGSTFNENWNYVDPESVTAIGSAVNAIIPALQTAQQIKDVETVRSILGLVASVGDIFSMEGAFTSSANVSSVGDAMKAIIPALQDAQTITDTESIRAAIDLIAYTGEKLEDFSVMVPEDLTLVGKGLNSILPALKKSSGFPDAESVASAMTAIGLAGDIFKVKGRFSHIGDVSGAAAAIEALVPALKSAGTLGNTDAINAAISLIRDTGDIFGNGYSFSNTENVTAIGGAMTSIIDALKTAETVSDFDKIGSVLGIISQAGLVFSQDWGMADTVDAQAVGTAMSAIVKGLGDAQSITDTEAVMGFLGIVREAGDIFGKKGKFTNVANAEVIGNAISTIVPALIDAQGITNSDSIKEAIGVISYAASSFVGAVSLPADFNPQVIADTITKISPALASVPALAENYDSITRGIDLIKMAAMSFYDYVGLSENIALEDVMRLASAFETIVPALTQVTNITDPDAVMAALGSIKYAGELFGNNSGLFGLDMVAIGDGLSAVVSAVNGLNADQIALLERLGIALMTDFGSGISSVTAEIETSFDTMLSNLTMTITAYDATWVTLGGNITAGIANGIMSRTAEAASAMASMASSLATSFTVTLGINSPSRVFAGLAGYIPEGVAKGITEGSGQVTDAMITAMSPAMMVLMSLMSSDYDFSPTITPVVDLSNVTSAANAVDGMFRSADLSAGYNGHVSSIADYVGNLASEMGEVTNITNNTGDSYNFNIYASEGMDEEAIADAVMNRIRTTTVRRGAAFG